MKKILLLLFVLANSTIYSQQWKMTVSGSLKDFSTQIPIVGGYVNIYANDTLIQSLACYKDGTFTIFPEQNQDYRLEFTCNGFVSRSILISTKYVSLKDVPSYGYVSNLSIILYKEIEGIDFSIFKKPIGMISFNSELKRFNFQIQDAGSINEKFELLNNEYKKKEKKMRKEEK